MDTDDPSTVLQSFRKKSFAEILASDSLGKSTVLDATPLPQGDKLQIGLHKGQPSVRITKQRQEIYTAPFKWAIVGKFSQRRPLLEDIHSALVALDLKEKFQIGLLDSRHVIINFVSEEDYLRIFSRPIWHIGKSVMRVLKWSVNFHVDRESPIVPVWVELEKLPIFLFHKEALFAIASTIGKPLRLDPATAAISNPSVARFQVELDLLKERPDMVWIDLEDTDGFWQKIKYKNIPSYCCHCWHLGHDQNQCHIKNPSLKISDPHAEAVTTTSDKQTNLGLPQQVYKVKERTTETNPISDEPAFNSFSNDKSAAVGVNLLPIVVNDDAPKGFMQNISLEDTSVIEVTNELKALHSADASLVLQDQDLSNSPQLLEPEEAVDTETHQLQLQETSNMLYVQLPPLPPLTNDLTSSKEDISSSNLSLINSKLNPTDIDAIVQQVFIEAADKQFETIADAVLNSKPQDLSTDDEIEPLANQSKIIQEANLSPRKKHQELGE